MGVDRNTQMKMGFFWGWVSRDQLRSVSPLLPRGPGTPTVILFDSWKPLDLSALLVPHHGN